MTTLLMNAGNWIATSFVPNQLPVDNDTVHVKEGVGDVTDAAGNAEGIDHDLLTTHPLFTGEFGELGTPINTIADLIHVMGAGGFYFRADGETANAVTDEIILNPSGQTSKWVIGCNPSDLGKIGIVRALGGVGIIEGNVVWEASSKVIVEKPGSGITGLSVSIASGGPTLPKLEVSSGQVFSNSVVTSLDVSGGQVTQDLAAATTIKVESGGRLNYDHYAVGGEVTICEVKAGGILDLMQNSGEKVFDFVVRYPGGTILRDPNRHTFTVYRDLAARFAT